MQRLCKDHDEQCAAWAAVPGECERNQDFMWSRCQGSCHICMIDNLMAKSFQELALYSLRNAVRGLADAGPVRVPPAPRTCALGWARVRLGIGLGRSALVTTGVHGQPIEALSAAASDAPSARDLSALSRLRPRLPSACPPPESHE